MYTHISLLLKTCFFYCFNSVNNFFIAKSIYKNKNKSKFKNKLVKAFCNMPLQH